MLMLTVQNKYNFDFQAPVEGFTEELFAVQENNSPIVGALWKQIMAQ